MEEETSNFHCPHCSRSSTCKNSIIEIKATLYIGKMYYDIILIMYS